MKTLLPITMALVAFLSLAMDLHSQAPAPKSPADLLKAMKAKNQELIEKQQATLQKLDDLDKEADQLKAFGKRT